MVRPMLAGQSPREFSVYLYFVRIDIDIDRQDNIIVSSSYYPLSPRSKLSKFILTPLPINIHPSPFPHF